MRHINKLITYGVWIYMWFNGAARCDSYHKKSQFRRAD